MRLIAQATAPTTAPTTLPSITEAGAWTRGVEKLQQTGLEFVSALPNLLTAAIVFTAFYLLGWGIKKLVHRFATEKRKHRNVAIVLGRVAQGVIFVIGLLVAAVIIFPNYTPTSLLTTLGIGGLAIGFAFKDVLENYLAGILMLLTEPFRIGDQVVFQEFEGTVEEIQTRATTIRTYDGRRIVVPNAQLFTNPVTVNTAFEKRRLEYDFGIGYGDDIDRAKALMMESLRELPETVLSDPPPETLTYDLAASTVNIRVRWWIQPPLKRDALEARDQVLTAIKKKLSANGIDLPFATTQILFHDQTEETDGDRGRQREGWPAPMGGGDAPRPIGLGRRREAKDQQSGAGGGTA